MISNTKTHCSSMLKSHPRVNYLFRFHLIVLRKHVSPQECYKSIFSARECPNAIILPRVCTETQFFSEDFGEGVSETESEDEEEFVTPTGGVGGVAEGSTNTHQAQTSAHAQRSSSSRSGSRPPSPSAGKAQARSQSRPHSPLSDMDTESKRNSQVGNSLHMALVALILSRYKRDF